MTGNPKYALTIFVTRRDVGQQRETGELCNVKKAVQSNTELVEISILVYRKRTVVVVIHHSNHVPRGTVQCDGNAPDVLLWNAA